MDKKILVTRSSMPPFEEYADEIKDMWDTHWLTNMGVKHKQLEKDLADYLGISKENIALFVNGHQALECILEAFQLGKEKNAWGEPKNEVITTPFTFASTTHAIVRKGLKPVFCDIKEDDYTLDPDKIEALITDRTCAIVPVHVYGNLCDTEKIEKIAKKHNLKVIYDAAHAFGVEKNGVSSAIFGDASMFSFHATKVFNTIEGGAVCFKDSSMKKVLNEWKNFGITGPETTEFIGGNAKMNEFQAAMGLCNLPCMGELIEERRQITLHYRERLTGVAGIHFFEPDRDPAVHYNFAYLPVLIEKERFGVSRDEVYDRLKREEVFTRRYFWPIVPDFGCYRAKHEKDAIPVTRKVGEQVLCLPIYNGLSLEQVDRIVDAIMACR